MKSTCLNKQWFFFFIVPLLLCRTFICFGDNFSSSGYAKGGAEYLKLPAHAYNASLSGAVTSWCDDIAGFQYNPAIIENLLTYHLAVSNTFFMDDRVFYAFEAAGPIGEYLVLGGSLINAGVKTIERRNEFGTLEGYFSDEELAVTLAVAGRLQWNISWGAAGRYMIQKLDNEDAHGMGFDFGATFQPDSAFRIGISLLNCASFLWWSTDHTDKVLLQARGGVLGKLIDNTLAVSCDIIKTLEQPVDIAFGVQYTLLQVLSLRMGMVTSIHTSSPKVRDPDISLGAGLRYSYYGIDYACTIPIEKYGVIHKASIIFEFSQKLH